MESKCYQHYLQCLASTKQKLLSNLSHTGVRVRTIKLDVPYFPQHSSSRRKLKLMLWYQSPELFRVICPLNSGSMSEFLESKSLLYQKSNWDRPPEVLFSPGNGSFHNYALY